MEPPSALSILPPMAWVRKNVPLTLTSKTVSHSAGVTSSGPVRMITPATLTRMSRPPRHSHARTAASASPRTSARSASTARKRRPFVSISWPSDASASPERARPTTSQPASASPSEIARPMPRLAPDTSALCRRGRARRPRWDFNYLDAKMSNRTQGSECIAQRRRVWRHAA